VAERVAEARRAGEAEAARQPKDANDGFNLLSGTRAIGALSAPRSPRVRTYSPIIGATIAIGIAAAVAILVATFGSPAWKFSAPAVDKVAQQAAVDKAAADKAAADKAAADKAAADKAAADRAAADKAAPDKAAGDEAAADKAAVSAVPLTAPQERALKPGDSFKECGACPEMIVVPAGRFVMGSPDDQGLDNERPPHDVIIAKPFAVAKFEATFNEWDACAAHGACVANLDDNGWGRGLRPAINVTWNDAQTYVKWLSGITGKEYRLLSEAEFEYAARSGTLTNYPWGDEIKLAGKAMANCDGCGSRWDGKQTARVGSFAANRFGLYDMVGNVFEWVEDCRHDDYQGAPADGSAWTSGDCSRRVSRSGSWYTNPDSLRSTYRWGGPPGPPRYDNLGFRVARTLNP
jgi:formylglycine-generating enzyme required for sulfatase activity